MSFFPRRFGRVGQRRSPARRRGSRHQGRGAVRSAFAGAGPRRRVRLLSSPWRKARSIQMNEEDHRFSVTRVHPSSRGRNPHGGSARGCPCLGSRRCSGTDPPQADWSAEPWMAERSQHRESGGPGGPQRTSGDGAWAAPRGEACRCRLTTCTYGGWRLDFQRLPVTIVAGRDVERTQ